MALALTPTNAIVEQAFSGLSHLLAPSRLHLDTTLVQQYMFLALDAVPWYEYDCSRVF